MKLKLQFNYTNLDRTTNEDGTRFYIDPTSGHPLASVTTILSATSDKKEKLIEWEERVGKKKADQVRKEATDLGTLMHTHVEHFVMGVPRPRGNNLIRQQAERMANQIITKGLCNVDEVWGQEVGMYYPGLYAGTTDLVGIHKGAEAVMDHKSARKMRSRDMIEDYFCQLAAYGMAHDQIYGTSIKKGVIFMVDRALNYEEFVIEGSEFILARERFLDRCQTYFSA